MLQRQVVICGDIIGLDPKGQVVGLF